jgi:hypothetical protein
MIKFINKKHINKDKTGTKLVIYYSVSDIVLGIILLILVGFFIDNYLNENLYPPKNNHPGIMYGPSNFR